MNSPALISRVFKTGTKSQTKGHKLKRGQDSGSCETGHTATHIKKIRALTRVGVKKQQTFLEPTDQPPSQPASQHFQRGAALERGKF